MLERNRDFGETRRRESIAIDGMVVALIEESNQRGCFLSFPINKGHAEPSFGTREVQWRKLAHLLIEKIKSMEVIQTVNNLGGSHKGKEVFRPTIGTINQLHSDVVNKRN